MDNRNKWILILLGIVLFATFFGFGIIFGISHLLRQAAEQTLAPIEEANTYMRTQVADLLHPTPTVLPNPITIIYEIRSLARLETIQYTLEKVITVEEGQGNLGFLFGDRLLFVGHGTVIAGVDLARLRPQDLWVEDGFLFVRLPPAEIFVVDLDNEKSYVYDRNTGMLTRGDINIEKTARISAEKEIAQAAIEDGILNQARENAESYLSRLLRGLGYSDVIFVDATPVPQK